MMKTPLTRIYLTALDAGSVYPDGSMDGIPGDILDEVSDAKPERLEWFKAWLDAHEARGCCSEAL